MCPDLFSFIFSWIPGVLEENVKKARPKEADTRNSEQYITFLTVLQRNSNERKLFKRANIKGLGRH